MVVHFPPSHLFSRPLLQALQSTVLGLISHAHPVLSPPKTKHCLQGLRQAQPRTFRHHHCFLPSFLIQLLGCLFWKEGSIQNTALFPLAALVLIPDVRMNCASPPTDWLKGLRGRDIAIWFSHIRCYLLPEGCLVQWNTACIHICFLKSEEELPRQTVLHSATLDPIQECLVLHRTQMHQILCYLE